MKDKTAKGELEKYTKKERVMLAKKMEKLARYYSGLIGLKKTPDALFIVDAKSEHIATTEARKSNIPIIALVNSDSLYFTAIARVQRRGSNEPKPLASDIIQKITALSRNR